MIDTKKHFRCYAIFMFVNVCSFINLNGFLHFVALKNNLLSVYGLF